ncbi:spermidine/putrescine-binding protein [Halarchaeum solikamskense]|uniref:ABC transporter substrate-binding protein n=1 Tax=Halarchaeum nitratireducens TaxID=489913 RepID=UPI001B3A88E2|nr:PotD/PotF family extracellular solute-binding protein [Halarchaeum solikamskense]MBP2252402.1 spermidine/putrescine-binding protein [Halarchaeum solikamskense]
MRDDTTTRRKLLTVTGAAGAAALAGCGGGGGGGSGSSSGNDSGSDDSSGYGGESLNVLTWAGYGGVAEMLEQQTGATVNVKLISSDVEGFNTLNAGGVNQFDVMVLDNTWAKRNARADTIRPVQEGDYPSRENWMSQFSWPYDTFVNEGQMYAAPPRWGWGGLGYDDRSVDLSTLEERGYAAAWDGSFDGEITLLDWPTWTIPLVIMQLFDLDGQNPMDIELSDSRLQQVEDTLVKMFDSAVAVHGGAAGVRQDMLQGNATLVMGTGNFGLSQLRAEGNDWMKLMYPSDIGGWYWTEGLTLVNNPDLNRDLAVEFHNQALTPEGQYSICWEDAESKGAPVNTAAFDEFSEEEQKTIMMYKDQGFEAAEHLLEDLVQYKISPQQDEWLDMWSRAKANSSL